MDCIKLNYVINIFIIYFSYVFVYLYFIQKCDNSLLMCVCVWAKCHFVSGELAYDDDYARNGKAQSYSGKFSDRCDIEAWGF